MAEAAEDLVRIRKVVIQAGVDRISRQRGGRIRGVVVPCTGAGKIRLGPQRQQLGGRWIEARRRDLVARKRLASDRVLYYGERSGEDAVAFGICRHDTHSSLSVTLIEAFPAAKEERAVVDDWPTDRTAILILTELGRMRLSVRSFDVIEGVTGIEEIVAQIFEGGAVKRVRAGFDTDDHHRAGIAPKFG